MTNMLTAPVSAAVCSTIDAAAALFDQGGVLLSYVVHLDDGDVDLVNAGELLTAGQIDVGHQTGDALDFVHDVSHRRAGLVHKWIACCDLAAHYPCTVEPPCP